MAIKEPRKPKRKGDDTGPTPNQQDLPADVIALHIKASLVREALEDSGFRKLALSKPASAIQKSRFIGGAEKSLPAGFKFRVVEETPQLLYLVVPHKVAEASLDPDNPKNVLLQKAVADAEYLKKLTTNPKAVIEAEFLVDVPPGFEVKVLKETPLESIVVLPANLRPDQQAAIPKELLEYQAIGWGGGGGCAKTFLGSLIENLCGGGGGGETDAPSPFCTVQGSPDCPIGPSF